MSELKDRVVRGAAARVVAQVANVLIRMGSLVVFARLLEPKDFGIVGMVTAVTGIFSVFKDFGLSTAAVQQETLSNAQASTMFWVNLLLGGILCALTLVCAPILVRFYDEPRLLLVTVALAAGFLINAAGIQHSAQLQREMRFVALAAIEVIALLASSAIGLAMAAAGLGYWALVGWSLLLPTVNSAGAWIAAAWIPSRPERRTDVRALIQFGTTYTLNAIVIYVAYNLDKLLVGRMWGASALGIYGRAFQLVTLPADGVIGAIGGVAFSALSRVQQNGALLRSYFLKGYKIVLTLTVPITLLMALYAEEIVMVLLGPKWTSATATLRFLTPTLLVFAMINPTGWLMLASGRIKRSLQIALVIAPWVIVGYVLGLPYGVEGVALGFSASMTLWVVPHILWATKGSAVSAADLFRVMIKPCIAGAVAGILTLGFDALYGAAMAPFMRLASGGTALVILYFAMLLLVLGERTFYLDLVSTLTRRRSVTKSVPE
ncbi:MAG: lipopolysaccharide biosynthesis protein [Burkholderiales bacterium]